jgi:hypothetical protein
MSVKRIQHGQNNGRINWKSQFTMSRWLYKTSCGILNATHHRWPTIMILIMTKYLNCTSVRALHCLTTYCSSVRSTHSVNGSWGYQQLPDVHVCSCEFHNHHERSTATCQKHFTFNKEDYRTASRFWHTNFVSPCVTPVTQFCYRWFTLCEC